MQSDASTKRERYRFTGYRKFLDPEGYPAVAPPRGTLNAIDLNTGKYLWKIPLGEYPELAQQGMKDTGTENYSGPIVTAGGLVFIGATMFDKKYVPSIVAPVLCCGNTSCRMPVLQLLQPTWSMELNML